VERLAALGFPKEMAAQVQLGKFQKFLLRKWVTGVPHGFPMASPSPNSGPRRTWHATRAKSLQQTFSLTMRVIEADSLICFVWDVLRFLDIL
jgi:hypothetical protein